MSERLSFSLKALRHGAEVLADDGGIARAGFPAR